MSAPLTLERLATINSAASEYRTAKLAADEASRLKPIAEKQRVAIGIQTGGQLYRQEIDVPISIINTMIRDRQTVANARLAAATRALNQLNVEVPK